MSTLKKPNKNNMIKQYNQSPTLYVCSKYEEWNENYTG